MNGWTWENIIVLCIWIAAPPLALWHLIWMTRVEDPHEKFHDIDLMLDHDYRCSFDLAECPCETCGASVEGQPVFAHPIDHYSQDVDYECLECSRKRFVPAA